MNMRSTKKSFKYVVNFVVRVAGYVSCFLRCQQIQKPNKASKGISYFRFTPFFLKSSS